MSDFTKQQEAAIKKRGNLLVVAGAGTGKTRTLVARCLRIVAEQRVSLENILMVTFTEAAAAEMRGRLRHQLRQLQSTRPNDGHLAEQLALLDTARISTLHSFCLQLAREHFHELGLDPQFTVLDEQQTRPLQREALEELLQKHYAGKSVEDRATQELIRAVGRGSDQPIRQLVLKLHAYTQSLPDPVGWWETQRKHFEQPEPTEWRKLFPTAVKDWRLDWREELRSADRTVPAIKLCLDAMERLYPKTSLETAGAALQAVVVADTADDSWPRGTKGKVREPLADFFAEAEFLASLLPADEGNDPIAQDWEWARHNMLALIDLIGEFTHEFSARKRDLGGVDFADLEQCALRLLHDPATGKITETARAWRERLEHVFVDEYQDINAAQDSILTALSRNGEGNRFLVGDAKQSIYRFRLANPKIFQRYRELWSATSGSGKAISLTENFRSRAGLLDFINPLFSTLMSENIGGLSYELLKFGAPDQRAKLNVKAGDSPRVEFHLIARAKEFGELNETEQEDAGPELLTIEREARLVAQRLIELKKSGMRIWNEEAGGFTAVEWRDMAVLLRSPSGRAEAFAMEFNKAGVPLSAARDGFFASLEVSDLLNLLKLLDNPLQDVPLLAVLRSPLVGMSLDELAEIRAHNPAKPFWTAMKRWREERFRSTCSVQQPPEDSNSLSPERQGEDALRCAENIANKSLSKVDGFLKQFDRWRELVRQTSLSKCIEIALTESNYEDLLLAGDRGVERVANVRRLLDLARQFDPFQRQGLYRFLRFVQAQKDEELDLEPASAPTENAVKLMSIHRSKGLEFPVVVLAGMGTRFNEQDLRGPVLLHESLGLCPKIIPPRSAQSYPSLTHWFARRTERIELRGEELRLFYVALTRARDALILVGSTNGEPDTVKWTSRPTDAPRARKVTEAGSHLEWLRLWLPSVTDSTDWSDERCGANKLLSWRIHDGNNVCFKEPSPAIGESTAAIVSTPVDEKTAVRALKNRLAWQYPFGSATTRAAKTSVSELRRRATEELDEESIRMFGSKFRRSVVDVNEGRTIAGKISAVERGTAHHLFLQCVELAGTGSEAELRSEAKRLQRTGALAPEQVDALDFGALTRFWQSETGKQVREQSGNVRRELGFTARFAPSELDKITRRTVKAKLEEEFVVVQGVADLVVLLPDDIWLLDFKTDEVTPEEVTAKRDHYAPQLELYALALSRIYRKPVRKCWLHFLACGATVSVETRAETR